MRINMDHHTVYQEAIRSDNRDDYSPGIHPVDTTQNSEICFANRRALRGIFLG